MDQIALIEQIKSDEGWRPHPYRDTEGYLTIGYGFLIDPERGDGMPLGVGDFWIRQNVSEIIDRLRRTTWYGCQPEIVQQAVVNMAYQLGVNGLYGFRRMIVALSNRDYALAADEALDSLWARQTPSRADRIAAMIRSAA